MTEEDLRAVKGDQPVRKNPNLQQRTPEQLAVLSKAREKALAVRKENAELKRKEKELAKIEKEKEKATRKKNIETKYKALKEPKSKDDLVEEEYVPEATTKQKPASPVETEVDEPEPEPEPVKLERQKPVKKSKKKVVVVEESESESDEEEVVYIKKKPARKTALRQRRVQYIERDEEPRRQRIDSNPPQPTPEQLMKLETQRRLYDAFSRGHY